MAFLSICTKITRRSGTLGPGRAHESARITSSMVERVKRAITAIGPNARVTVGKSQCSGYPSRQSALTVTRKGEEQDEKHRDDKIRQGDRQHSGKGAEVIDWAILVHCGTNYRG